MFFCLEVFRHLKLWVGLGYGSIYQLVKWLIVFIGVAADRGLYLSLSLSGDSFLDQNASIVKL